MSFIAHEQSTHESPHPHSRDPQPSFAAPQPHERLHRHALESIFALLTFSELTLAGRASRCWMATVSSMRGLESGYQATGTQLMLSGGLLSSMVHSRMARHVTSIGSADDMAELPAAQMRQLAEQLPFLRQLHTHVTAESAADTWTAELQLPARLHTLGLLFDTRAATAHLNAVLVCTARHPSLQTIEVSLSGVLHASASFAPLQQLPHLTSLCIQPSSISYADSRFVSLTAAQAAELRALPQLSLLECPLHEEAMCALLQPSPSLSPLQWTDLPHGCQVTDAVGALFASLPHVGHFHAHVVRADFQLSSLNCLALLPALRELRITGCGSDVAFVAWMALDQPLRQVTLLHLGYMKLVTDQLATLLMHFPRLEELHLEQVDGFDALTFLQPVQQTLRTLCMDECGWSSCSPDAAMQLAELQQLTELELQHCFSSRVSDALRAILQVPSALLPNLQWADVMD